MARDSNTLFEVTDVYWANRFPIVRPAVMEDGSAAPVVMVNQGGTWSSKTISILQCLFAEALENPGEYITVAGQDIPNLKVGAVRDAQRIVDASPTLKSYLKPVGTGNSVFNKSERIYTFLNGSVIEFNSYDDFQDAKSGKRDRLFCNEINGIPKRVYEELAMRTSKKIYVDYNPNEEFWVHTDLVGSEGVQLIRSDHRHNTFLTQAQHNRIESIPDKELWNVYARGLTGKLEGLILRNWTEVAEVPATAKLIAPGLDFGFTNDPTACIDVWEGDGELYLDERVYETNLTNPDISERMAATGGSMRNRIIADSADPKSIKELSNLGWSIEGAQKGPDSVRDSIDILKRYKLNVTKRSYNLKKELNSYKWRQDKKTGKTLNEPVDFMNHGIDAVRYVALNRLGHTKRTGKYSYD